MDTSLNTYLSEIISKRVKETVDAGELEPEYQPTRIVGGNEGRIVFFTVKGSPVKCYSNILDQRRDIHSALSVGSDEEAYLKMLDALYNPSSLEFSDFNEYYRAVDLNFFELPFIKYYREDGGYYLTSSIISSCYRNTCNLSFHRMMRLNAEEAAVRIVPRHLEYIVGKHHSEDRDAPAAIILGVHPALEIAAASSPPLGVFELSVAARLLGDNLATKTPIYGIPVPANAGIVIEGTITRRTEWEGPFVDILRIPDEKRRQPVFHVDEIYVSRERAPLIHAIVPGLSEHLNLMGFPREPLIYDSVRRVAPRVRHVRLSRGGGGWLHVIIGIEKTREGEGLNAGLAALTGHPSAKHVVVVDDDIDVDDPVMVEWAIATRVKAGSDILVIRDARGSTLDPRGTEGLGDKMVIDATRPLSESVDKYRMAGIP